MNTLRRVRRAGACSMHGGNEKCLHSQSQKIGKDLSGSLGQYFSTAGPRPSAGPWHQLYWAARGSPEDVILVF